MSTMFSGNWALDTVGEVAAAAKSAALPSAAKRPRGNRAGKKTSKAGHVNTTEAQRDELARKVEQTCVVAGCVAVAMERLKEKKK